MTMRLKAVPLAGAVAVGLALTACAPSGPSESASGDRASTVVITNPYATTFTENFSPLSPSGSDVNVFWFYEPLIRVAVGGEIQPWLSTDQVWDSAASTWTLSLRDDVTWADGTDMTVDDVVFSLQSCIDNPEFGFGFDCRFDTVTAAGDEVVLHYPDGWSVDNATALGLRPIVPKADWADRDATTIDAEPNGSGPFVIDDFSQQQITVAARDDYWGGELPMEKVKVLAASPQAAQSQITSGEADWGSIDWPGGESSLESAADSRWWQRDAGNGMALFFNHTAAPFNDPAFRKAISATIDREKLAAISGVDNIAPANQAGLALAVYEDWITPEYRTPSDPAPDEARDQLTAAGYEIIDGKLSKDGTVFDLDIAVDNSAASNVAIATGIKDQLASGLGLEIAVSAQNSQTFSDAYQAGEFGMAVYWQGNSQGPAMVYERVLDPAKLAPIGTATPINASRWSDDATNSLLQAALSTPDQEVQKENVRQLEDIVVEQVPFAPLVTSAMSMQISEKYWTGWPDVESAEYYPFPYGWGLMGTDGVLTLLNLEPAS